MTTFDSRKNSFENKFKHDQEIRFKVSARRNKLIGLWAAELMGRTGPDADRYAKDVAIADLEKTGDDDVVEKLLADFTANKIDMDERQVRKKLIETGDLAKKQVMDEM